MSRSGRPAAKIAHKSEIGACRTLANRRIYSRGVRIGNLIGLCFGATFALMGLALAWWAMTDGTYSVTQMDPVEGKVPQHERLRWQGQILILALASALAAPLTIVVVGLGLERRRGGAVQGRT